MQANKGTASRKAVIYKWNIKHIAAIIAAIILALILVAVFTNKADGETPRQPPELHAIKGQIGSEQPLAGYGTWQSDTGTQLLEQAATQKLADQAAEAKRLEAERQEHEAFLAAEAANTARLNQALAQASESPQAPPGEVSVDGSVESIICSYDWDCTKALRVANCESGYDPAASNGQYQGVWQMGSNERATYGHGPDLATQTAAAYSYYSVAGWGPWECQ